MITNFLKLPKKTVDAAEKRLAKFIPADRFLAVLQADDDAMQRLLAAWPAVPEVTCSDACIVYDAVTMSRLLGVPLAPDEEALPVPHPAKGEIITYYGGWDLLTLRNSVGGHKCMFRNPNNSDESKWKARAGYYRIKFFVPGSQSKDWDEQALCLEADDTWRPLPVAIAVSAVIAHLLQTGNHLLHDGACRCAETFPNDNYHVCIHAHDGCRVKVTNVWNWDHVGHLWIAACQKI